MGHSNRLLTERVEDVIRDLDAATDLDMVFAALSKRMGRMGFANFSYWLILPPEGPRKRFFVSNYSVDWLEYYTYARGYGSIDYVGRYAAKTMLPFLWDHVLERHPLTATQKQIFHEAASIGMPSGGTIPVHGPLAAKATFTLANDMRKGEFAKLFTTHRHELHLMAMYVHERILRFNLHTPVVGPAALTPREIEALRWIAKGKTRWEVGMILNISEETVKAHLENARKKLAASNTAHAIAVAVLNGLLQP